MNELDTIRGNWKRAGGRSGCKVIRNSHRGHKVMSLQEMEELVTALTRQRDEMKDTMIHYMEENKALREECQRLSERGAK